MQCARLCTDEASKSLRKREMRTIDSPIHLLHSNFTSTEPTTEPNSCLLSLSQRFNGRRARPPQCHSRWSVQCRTDWERELRANPIEY